MIFHVAVLASSALFSQRSCAGPKIADASSIAVWRFALFAPL